MDGDSDIHNMISDGTWNLQYAYITIGTVPSEVTLTLSADQADALREVLSQLDAGDDLGGDIDDIEDIEGEGDELESMESHVELQAAPDSIGSLTGQNNKAALSTDGGGADSSASGQEDGGKPKAAADGKAGLQGKSNKVSDLKGNAFSH